MKQWLIISVSLVCLSVCQAWADDHRNTMEMYTCNYAEGKDHSDYMDVVGDWNKFAKSTFSEPYAGYVLTPVYAQKSDFPMDFIWLGVSGTPEQMGTLADEWMDKGSEFAKRFEEVAPCSSHSLWTSLTFREYPQAGSSGYLQVRSCRMKPGVSGGQIRLTQEKIAAWMDEHEIPGGNYLWVPGLGAPIDSEVDFYNVWVTESLADRGRGAMAFGKNNWRDDFYQIAGDDSLAQCDNWRLWHAQPAGGSEID